jgi:hypothetical protein
MGNAESSVIWWFLVFFGVGAVAAFHLGRLVEVRWPSASIPCFVTLGCCALFLSWTAAIELTGSTPPLCGEVFRGMNSLDQESRSELLERCIATADPSLSIR